MELSERMIREQDKHNPDIYRHRHLILQIKTLQNASQDPDKLQALLRSKEREKKQESTYEIADTQRLVTEIEMLKAVLHFVRVQLQNRLIQIKMISDIKPCQRTKIESSVIARAA
jgi:hypothetical protein